MSVSTPAVREVDPLDPLSARRAMRLNIIAGSIGSVFLAATTGMLLTGFALSLEADNSDFGLLGAIPLFAFAAQIPGAYLTERFRNRKLLWAICCGLHRLLWLPILLIPYLFGWTTKPVQLQILLVLVLLSSILAQACVPAWMSWMADVVPARQAGRFWGRRAAILMVVVFGMGIPLAMLMDCFKGNPEIGYTLVFGIAVVFGVADVLLHKWIDHPPMPPRSHQYHLRDFLKPFKSREFRQFLLLTCSWNFAVQLFVPFINVYFRRDLKMSFLQIALLNTSFAVSSLVFSRFWGYVIDHFGKRPVIELLIVLKFIIPGAYLFTHPGFFWPVLIPTFIFDGFLVAGLVPAFQAASLSYSPREDKSMFIAMYQTTMGLVSAIGPVMAGLVMAHIPDFTFDYGPFHWTVIHLAFFGSVLVRLVVWPLGRRLSEPGAASAMSVLRSFMDSNPFRVVRHLYILDESSDLNQRISSTRALQRKPGRMAVERLLEAIDDPDRDVRAAAALALGEVNCPESIQALIHALRSPDLDIQQPAARALGTIGTHECIEALVEVLTTSEDATLRGHVARVLGQTHKREVVLPLLSVFHTDHATGVLASAAEALSRLGEIKALRAILPQMHEIEEPAVRAQMAVAIGNLLGEEGEFYSILGEDKRVKGLGWSKVQNQIIDDLRAMRLADGGNGNAAAIAAMNESYLAGNYAETCRQCRFICHHLFGLHSADEDEQQTEFLGQMQLFLLAEPKFGVQMWFLFVMGAEEWVSRGRIGLEIALLSEYALSKIVSTLRRRPELLSLQMEKAN